MTAGSPNMHPMHHPGGHNYKQNSMGIKNQGEMPISSNAKTDRVQNKFDFQLRKGAQVHEMRCL